MNVSDTAKVQRYLRQRFGNHKLTLARRENRMIRPSLCWKMNLLGLCFAMMKMATHVTMSRLPCWPKI